MTSSERLKSIGDLHATPATDLGALFTMAGLSMGTKSEFSVMSPHGTIYVPMNAAKHTRITKDSFGQIFTTALASCTGIAGLAMTKGDTLAGISHFDALVDGNQRREGLSPSGVFIEDFTRIGRYLGAEAIAFTALYWPGHKEESTYDNPGAERSQQHFLTQLEDLAAGVDSDVTIDLVPYEDIWKGHTLAVSVDLGAQAQIEFL